MSTAKLLPASRTQFQRLTNSFYLGVYLGRPLLLHSLTNIEQCSQTQGELASRTFPAHPTPISFQRPQREKPHWNHCLRTQKLTLNLDPLHVLQKSKRKPQLGVPVTHLRLPHSLLTLKSSEQDRREWDHHPITVPFPPTAKSREK